eukprot:364673-Chlamydomonas_euryale.AAC.5
MDRSGKGASGRVSWPRGIVSIGSAMFMHAYMIASASEHGLHGPSPSPHPTARSAFHPSSKTCSTTRSPACRAFRAPIAAALRHACSRQLLPGGAAIRRAGGAASRPGVAPALEQSSAPPPPPPGTPREALPVSARRGSSADTSRVLAPPGGSGATCSELGVCAAEGGLDWVLARGAGLGFGEGESVGRVALTRRQWGAYRVPHGRGCVLPAARHL